MEVLLDQRHDWLARYDETEARLNQLLRNGKIKTAGVSNYTASQFDLLSAQMEKPLATNQLEFHLLRHDPMHDGTFHQCEKLGIPPMAWSPMAGGRLLQTNKTAGQRPAVAADTKYTPDVEGA